MSMSKLSISFLAVVLIGCGGNAAGLEEPADVSCPRAYAALPKHLRERVSAVTPDQRDPEVLGQLARDLCAAGFPEAATCVEELAGIDGQARCWASWE